jgi:hypothetical protein
MMEKGDNVAGKDGRPSRHHTGIHRMAHKPPLPARWRTFRRRVAYRKSKLANLAAERMKFSETEIGLWVSGRLPALRGSRSTA